MHGATPRLQRVAPVGIAIGRERRNAEIEHLHLAVVPMTVGGLDVAMGDAALVGGRDRIRQRQGDVEEPLEGQAVLGDQR